MASRRERNQAKLTELEGKQRALRKAGMSKRHPEYRLLQKERDAQFKVTEGYPVGCICPGLNHGTNRSCTAS
jgi:hypothetical protein